VVVLGAVWLGGLITRSFPHDQVLIFPVGSVFPKATRFSASWKRVEDSESRGGVTLSFTTPPPLQIRHHSDLPNGDYIVSIEIVSPRLDRAERAQPPPREPSEQESQNAGLSETPRGVQTNIERRVTLIGGETLVALAAGGF
jgi:hypothetical protein